MFYKLTSGGNVKHFQYDECGNPTTYKNSTQSQNMYWTRGQLLSRYDNQFTGMISTFKYNAAGLRTYKSSGGITKDYYLDGDKIVGERDSNGLMLFSYDNGGPMGFMTIEGSTKNQYFYEKDLQGNIVAIQTYRFGFLHTIAKYTYDAWGNCTEVDSDGSGLCYRNPLRWKSHYYDKETKLYYINGNYYDPETGRMVTSHNFGEESIYALPCNNPLSLFPNCVNIYPSFTIIFDGEESRWWHFIIGGSLLLTAAFAIIAAINVLTCGLATPLMIGIAVVTGTAGVATAVNGVAEIQEGFTGDNFMRDDVFGGNQTAYNWYSFGIDAIATVGSIWCGGWLKINQPRIQAFKAFKAYQGDKIVIGEGMKRVTKIASKTGASFYDGLHFYSDLAKLSPELATQAGLMHNGLWLLGQTSNGALILDIGIITGTSISYAFETALLASLQYSFMLFI